MKHYLTIFICLVLLLSGCDGCFINHTDPPPTNQDIDFILINNTIYDDLTVYYSKDVENCTNMVKLAKLGKNQSVPIHVDPGQTVYIRYCAPTDDQINLCRDCRSKKLIGNTGEHSRVSLD